MIYGNIDATSWSVREIPPAGYSNAMNIARRDKRRTNSDRRDEKREGKERRNGCETSGRERGDAGAEWRGGARVKDTRKGFLVVYSVCKMSSQTCTHRVPSSRKGKRKRRKDAYPCVWIIRCIESREHRSLFSPITQCQRVRGDERLWFERETFKNTLCY